MNCYVWSGGGIKILLYSTSSMNFLISPFFSYYLKIEVVSESITLALYEVNFIRINKILIFSIFLIKIFCNGD